MYRHEFKNNHERWINSVKPILDPSILADMSSSLDDSDANVEYCHYARNETRMALNALLKVRICPISFCCMGILEQLHFSVSF